MADFANLSREDGIGLGIAVAAHIALAGAFFTQSANREPIPVPERMVVSLASDVSLESTAPDPSNAPQASFAPEIAAEPVPEIMAEPEPVPVPRVAEPPPRPIAQPAPPPPPTARPAPRPAPTAAPRPAPTPVTRTAPPAPAPPARAAPAPQPARTQAATGSRIGADFLQGSSDTDSSRAGSPASNFGPTEQAALNSAISRQLKPHWQAPSGVDSELLVTIVRFRLNQDGSLSANPTCVQQSGETPSNSNQKSLHCERAIRAVRLASPFNLPAQFYDQWRLINSTFDRRL